MATGKKTTKKTLLYRVDGGYVWGVSMGHLKRAMGIAEHLKNDFDIYFIMKNYPDGVLFVKKNGWKNIILIPDQHSDDILIEICKQYSPEKIVFDLFSTPYTELFRYTESRNISTIVFDIRGEVSGIPDIIINDSFVPQFISYPDKIHKTKIYIGPRFFMFDNPPKPIPIHRDVNEITLTMGGSDPAGITLKILGTCLPDLTCYKLNIVLGPAYKDQEKVNSLVKKHDNIRILKDPPEFHSLLSKSDVVITAAGRTLYECAYLGRPLIIVPTIEHESVTAKKYAELSGSIDVGCWDTEKAPEKIIHALFCYAHDYHMRKTIYKKSRQVVDNKGIQRVLKIINT
jgi:spore coat polysaccharide biosynthesis predicted glycosyltransferase SpsG